MRKISLIFLCLCLAAVALADRPKDRPRDRNKNPYKVICYLGAWSYYRSSFGKFQAEDINPNLCTQINYGFAKLDENTNKIALYDPDLDYGDEDWTSGLPWGRGMIRRVRALRDYNPNLTTVIAVGGWNEGSNKYSRMASNPATRKIFIDSVMEFLDFHDLDGLDVDWEYPSMSADGDQSRVNGRDQDKEDFISLLSELRAAFEPYGYVLSAAVSAGEPTAERAYDFARISQHLDSINLMTYDFHGAWDDGTAHNAPLYSKPGATGLDKQFTTSYGTEFFINNGVDRKKLLLGIPLYGRTFTLADPSVNGYGAPTHGPGVSGPVTNVNGMLGYHEVCSMNDYTRVFDNDIKAPYKYGGNQWIGYDDVESVGLKVDYALSQGLGGALIWSVDTDDFTGRCGQKYPLLKVISGKLNQITGPDTRIPREHIIKIPKSWVPDKPSNPEPEFDPTDHTVHDRKQYIPEEFVCKSEGFFKDTRDETMFHYCVMHFGRFEDLRQNCAPGTVYDDSLKLCVHKRMPDIPDIPAEFVCQSEGIFKDTRDEAMFHVCIDVHGKYFHDIPQKCVEGTVYDDSLEVCVHKQIPAEKIPAEFVCQSEGIFKDTRDEAIFHSCVMTQGENWLDRLQKCAPGTVFDDTMKVCVHKQIPAENIPAEFVCQSEGTFKDTRDEAVFHTCVMTHGENWQDFRQECAPGTVFDDTMKVCVHKQIPDIPDIPAEFVCKSEGYFKDTRDPAMFHMCIKYFGRMLDIRQKCVKGAEFDDSLKICIFQ